MKIVLKEFIWEKEKKRIKIASNQTIKGKKKKNWNFVGKLSDLVRKRGNACEWVFKNGLPYLNELMHKD